MYKVFFFQVLAGDQFGLEWADFDIKRKTVVIIHGFMSHSNASWVHNMTRAFLQRVSTYLSIRTGNNESQFFLCPITRFIIITKQGG